MGPTTELLNSGRTKLSKPESEEHSDFPFDEYRLLHFLWNSLLILDPYRYISPHHKNLIVLAEKLSYFLEDQFKHIHGQSSVKKFLASPNRNGVEVKRKLLWLGTKSYLFRIEKDSDDNKYVDCAVIGNVDFIVTDDRHFNVLKDIPFPPLSLSNLVRNFLRF